MLNKKLADAFILLRIPFSVFLMPVFWYALSRGGEGPLWKMILIFIILHLFMYPASNGYNSLFDKDTTSIGGLKNPPPVNNVLRSLVLVFELISLLLSLIISVKFAIFILIYILISKAYSYDKIRLKKYAIISALIVCIFQGGFIFITVCFGLGTFTGDLILPSIISSLFLLGSYPLTQIYQHVEDRERGDKTLSILLGMKGTFIFSAIVFAIASAFLIYDFIITGNEKSVIIYLIAMIPVLLIFNTWMLKVFKNTEHASFENTMRMNKISSLSLSAAFIIMMIINI